MKYGLTDGEYVTLQRIVRDDVMICQTSLVESLLSFEYECFNYDNISNNYIDHEEEIGEVEEEITELRDLVETLAERVVDDTDEIEGLTDDLKELEDEPDSGYSPERDERKFNVIALLNNLEFKVNLQKKEIEVNEKLIEELEEQSSDLRENNGGDNEVFEWWVVSSWLRVKLESRGEVILDNDYGTWWGRGTSGQSIELDSVIQDIAKSITND